MTEHRGRGVRVKAVNEMQIAVTDATGEGLDHDFPILRLVDFDVFEASNLNRQPLCNVSTLGQKKVEAGRRILLDANPCIEVRTVDCCVDENSHASLANHDVILQCVDSIAGRVATHRVGRQLGTPVISMTGQPGEPLPVSIYPARVYASLRIMPSPAPLKTWCPEIANRLAW